MALTKADKQWLVRLNVPIIHKISCDLCGQEDLTKYVYGALRLSHTWAELCIPCHILHGIGIGNGRGTIYSWNTRNGEYETTIALTVSYMQLLQDITTIKEGGD